MSTMLYFRERCKQPVQCGSPFDVKSPRKHRKKYRVSTGLVTKAKKCLVTKFPCKSRSGMSCAIDTGWQKRGFDSLTCE